MKNKLPKLFNNFYEVNQMISENLLRQKINLESSGSLSLLELEEFEELNKKYFSIIQELIRELKNKIVSDENCNQES